MNKKQKLWGYIYDIFCKNNVSIQRIEISKDSQCSQHYHEFKYNIFYVESGKIKVQQWKDDQQDPSETVLSQNESCIIKPRTLHRFVAIEQSVVYEIYYVELTEDDIVRKTEI
jgi:quercetin dioxygenase-like cupin family protein